MSNKAPQISLPKGGGALSGIGETFQPDLHTGTGNFSIPVEIPPGRGGFQPSVTLAYSTGNPNGAFGLGWALSVPGVRRKTSDGVPRYDGADVFVLSGAEDLVPVAGGGEGRQRYRPRVEGLFARIERITAGGQDHWEVRSRDGLRSRYGSPRPVDAAPGWRDPAAVSDPANPQRIFTWLLSETVDLFGNRIVYRYERDPDADGYDQRYLADIHYVDHGDAENPDFLVRIAFTYESRPDAFSDRRAGFEIRTTYRCSRIETWMQHTEPAVLARTVHLEYASAPGNAISLLRRVRVEGHDGQASQELPPLDLGYTAFTPQRRLYQNLTAPQGALPPTSLGHPDLELVDLFGNGLPCVLQMNGEVRYWRNTGDARLLPPRRMTAAPGVGLADPGVQLADMDGNGRADLLVTGTEQAGYYPLTFDGRFDERGFVSYRAAPAANLDDPEVRLVDLDGDGVIDALRTGESYELYFNDPARGWDRVERRSRNGAAVPDVSFSDPRVKLADLSGDGLTDIALLHDRRFEYWPYLGHGRWGQRVIMGNAPHFEDAAAHGATGYDPRRVLVGDVDGDGCADVAYVGDGHVTLWLNQSGLRFADPVVIRGTPPVSDVDAVRLVDLLGTGTQGILWSYDAGTQRGGNYKFLDLTGATKPYLLQEIDNHMGARTKIEYSPSTQYYLADERAGRPWRTTLPFPVQVVAAVEVVDEISQGKLTTQYRYHHGYWDGAEREFRGFGRVEQLDTERFERFNTSGLHGETTPFDRVEQTRFSPPLLTTTWFHLGPVGDGFDERGEVDFTTEYWSEDPPLLDRPATTLQLLRSLPTTQRGDALRSLRGLVLRTELNALDGSQREDRPFTVTEAQYGIREEDPPAESQGERRRIFFPHPVSQRTTQWERGTDPISQFSFTDAYDPYGLPGRQISLAVPRGRDFRVAAPAGEPYLGARTVTTYAQRDDNNHYLVDRVAHTTTREILNDGSPALSDLLNTVRDGTARLAITGQTLNYYDGEAFVGLPLGQIGDFGALVRSETLVLTEEILRQAYRGGDRPELPSYLVPGGPPAWTEEYPQPFRDHLPPLAGYTFSLGDRDRERGYSVNASRQRYDFHDGPARQARGLVTATRDPLGRDTTITYDRFRVLPVHVVDPVGLTTRAVHDYRVLQPSRVTDPNGNRAAFAFTPLGLLASTAVMGKDSEPVGDTLKKPGTRLVYDLSAFADSPPDRRQPISVRTIRRVHHAHDADVPPAERNETIETVEYSDGFGRLIQTRTQAEDTIFGDPIFGGNILPAAHDDPTTAQRAVTGRRNADRQRPNVVVSGWQIYDNKGRVAEKYEPFLTTGWDYAPPVDAQLGQRMTMFYDPRGQVVRTMNPDGSEQRVSYGVPLDLADPERFTPTPWEAYTYDANDNAGRTHPSEASAYEHHWNTPASITIDALGRTVSSTERHRPPPATPSDPLPPIEEFRTRSTYDIRGNLTSVTDALGRKAFQYVYDLADRPLRTHSIDAGVRRTILDGAGNEVEHRDSKGALILQTYDVLSRPVQLWARDDGTSAVTLRERLQYGDGGDPNQPAPQRAASRVANRLGALHQHYDEAGLLTLVRHDFKGNVVDKTRQVIADEVILAVFPVPDDSAPDWQITPFRIDWQPPEGTMLEAHAGKLLGPTSYETSTTYDALNRVKSMRYPRDMNGDRKELRPAYNRAGALEQVSLDGQIFVERIAYNAKGQRTLIALGNGVLTRYAYHPHTFRLLRLRSERYTQAAPTALTYQPTGAPLQDLAYQHDLAGNILGIVERTPGCGVAANPEAGLIADPELRALIAQGNALARRFTYDPLYRLISATGRECTGSAQTQPWADDPRCGFNSPGHGTPNQDNAPNLTSVYDETYTYDQVGNITRLRHTTGNARSARQFRLVPGTNRLQTLTAGATRFAYTYDANGNMTSEATSRHFEWDHSDHMKAFRTQADASEPSAHAHYLYDAAGQRVKKLVRKQGGSVAVTTYIDGTFEHHRWYGNGTSVGANNHLHVMDDQQRIALVRVGPPHPDDKGPGVQYHLGDHLGSSSLVVNQDGSFVNREEHTPYGETSFGSFGRKRYRFTGKERDEASGLSHHAARYYAPYLVRWVSTDPAGFIDGHNLYVYGRNNPLVLVDPRGTNSEKIGIVAGDLYRAAYEHESVERSLANAQNRLSDAEVSLWNAETRLLELDRDDPRFRDRLSGEFKEKKYQAARRTYENNIEQAQRNLRAAEGRVQSLERSLNKLSEVLEKRSKKAAKLGLSADEILDIRREGADDSLSDAIEKRNQRRGRGGGGAGGAAPGGPVGGGPTLTGKGVASEGRGFFAWVKRSFQGSRTGVAVRAVARYANRGAALVGVVGARDEGEAWFGVVVAGVCAAASLWCLSATAVAPLVPEIPGHLQFIQRDYEDAAERAKAGTMSWGEAFLRGSSSVPY